MNRTLHPQTLMVFCVLVVSIVMAAPCNAVQDIPVDDEFRSKVEKLLFQLEADSLLERRKAARQLTEMGPGILDVIDNGDFEFSDDAAESLTVIRSALEMQLSQSVMRSSKITMKGTMSLQEVFDELSKQSGNRIVGHEHTRAEVDVDCTDEDFWSVFDDVLDQAGLTVQPYGSQPGELKVATRPDTQIDRSDSANYVGAFRVEAIRCESTRDFISPAIDHCRLTLQVSWEPRLRPIALRGAMADIAVIDENDEPISVKGRDGFISAVVRQNIPEVELRVPFDLIDRDVKKISRLKATMSAVIPGRIETFKFDLTKDKPGAAVTKADATVTFGGVKKNVDVYSVGIRLSFKDANNALESHRGWVLQNEMYFIDNEGKKIQHNGLETRQHSKNEISINYIFANSPGTATLVYRSPAVIFTMPLEIDLRDIDLP